MRAAALLGADEVALMRVDGDELELRLRRTTRNAPGDRWPLDGLPRHPLRARAPPPRPGRRAATRPATRPSSPSSPTLGLGTVLILPVICGDEPLAVLEVYRVRAQAFTAREVDRARVLAQQFGAALDRLTISST